MKAGAQCKGRLSRRRPSRICPVHTKHPSGLCAAHRAGVIHREERAVLLAADEFVYSGRLDRIAALQVAVAALRRAKGLLP